MSGRPRNFATALIICGGLGLSVAFAGLFLGFERLKSQDHKLSAENAQIFRQHEQIRWLLMKLSANVKSQVGNRVANVKTWCDAINKTRDYDRAFVNSAYKAHVYRLGDLPCKAIGRKTAQSAQHHPKRSPK